MLSKSISSTHRESFFGKDHYFLGEITTIIDQVGSGIYFGVGSEFGSSLGSDSVN